MLIGQLTPGVVRETYLRGMDLGAAWHGPAADRAIGRLIDIQREVLEGRTGVLFARRHVRTLPDPGLTVGEDFDEVGPLMPYGPPDDVTQQYTLILYWKHVQWLDQVRLYQGVDSANVNQFEVVPLTSVSLSPIDRKVRIPAGAVQAPELAQAWAVDYTIGLGQIPLDAADWVMLSVAIEVLGLAGAGADVSHGLSSEMLTQDGMTEQVTYAGKGEEGPYSAPMKVYQTLRDRMNLASLRLRYQGLVYPP